MANILGEENLIDYYRTNIERSNIGTEALALIQESQRPDLTLEESASEPTHFNGSTPMRIKIKKVDLDKLDPREICSILCHETFHYLHRTEENASDAARLRFRIRTQSPPTGEYKWGHYEDELTITGTCPGLDAHTEETFRYSRFNENEVRKELGLTPRETH